jgi:hypothetical protein
MLEGVVAEQRDAANMIADRQRALRFERMMWAFIAAIRAGIEAPSPSREVGKVAFGRARTVARAAARVRDVPGTRTHDGHGRSLAPDAGIWEQPGCGGGTACSTAVIRSSRHGRFALDEQMRARVDECVLGDVGTRSPLTRV